MVGRRARDSKMAPQSPAMEGAMQVEAAEKRGQRARRSAVEVREAGRVPKGKADRGKWSLGGAPSALALAGGVGCRAPPGPPAAESQLSTERPTLSASRRSCMDGTDEAP